MRIMKTVILLMTLALTGTFVMPVSAQESISNLSIDKNLDEEFETPETVDLSQMTLISSETIDIDDEYYAEEELYVYYLAAGRSSASSNSAQYTSTVSIRNSSTNKLMLQWILTGVFTYNGSTSKCTSAYTNCYNNATSSLSVKTDYATSTGNTAKGNLLVVGANGSVYQKTKKISVSADGTVSRS